MFNSLYNRNTPNASGFAIHTFRLKTIDFRSLVCFVPETSPPDGPRPDAACYISGGYYESGYVGAGTRSSRADRFRRNESENGFFSFRFLRVSGSGGHRFRSTTKRHRDRPPSRRTDRPNEISENSNRYRAKPDKTRPPDARDLCAASGRRR